MKMQFGRKKIISSPDVAQKIPLCEWELEFMIILSPYVSFLPKLRNNSILWRFQVGHIFLAEKVPVGL